MRGLIYAAAAGAVAVSAFWAYRVNYQAQSALDRVAGLRSEIAREREALAVLRAEWAFLNGPKRLQKLVESEADAAGLGLSMMDGARFASFAEIPAPPPESFWAHADPAVFWTAAVGKTATLRAEERKP
jgi:hypothetical protein